MRKHANCLIIVLREGNQSRFELIYSIKSFEFSMWCWLYPPASLFMACKERYNLCMNREPAEPTYFIQFNNNLIVRNSKAHLVYWSRIISHFLKALCNLVYEVHWFCCLLICGYQNKENFAHRSLLSKSKLRRQPQPHAVSMAPSNLELRECFEPWKLSDFGRRTGTKLKKLEVFFPREKWGE